MIKTVKMSAFRIALIQMRVGPNKIENLKKAQNFINEARNAGKADVIILPVIPN